MPTKYGNISIYLEPKVAQTSNFEKMKMVGPEIKFKKLSKIPKFQALASLVLRLSKIC